MNKFIVHSARGKESGKFNVSLLEVRPGAEGFSRLNKKKPMGSLCLSNGAMFTLAKHLSAKEILLKWKPMPSNEPWKHRAL